MGTDANARGARPSRGHIPGLDGVRALSVLAIIAFHRGQGTATDGKVYVFGLNQVVDPGGEYSSTAAPTTSAVTTGSTSHNPAGSTSAWGLLPDLLALGQAHTTASPGGAWPGTMPPSTLSWFPSLPCQ